MTKIGTLQILRRYPVKSMKGEDLESAHVSFAGLKGDRVWAFVDPASTSNFPWVTARQIPEMILFEPKFRSDDSYVLEVTDPEGRRHVIDDPAFKTFLEARWNRKLTLRFTEKGMQDSRPISIFGMPSLRLLEQQAGIKVDHRRFRSNFYVEWDNNAPLYEEELIGKVLLIGEKLKVMITKRDPRCVIINLEPDTAVADATVLKTVGREHKGQIGVYAVTLQEGVAKVGDAIVLSDI